MVRTCFAAIGVLLTWLPIEARADEFADFERARAAYEQQDYARAVEGFEAMVGGEVPTIENPVLIKESRKYLGAALLFLGRQSEAEQVFELLLRSDLSYELDPLAFSAEVQNVFREVHERLAREAAEAGEQAERREAERRRAEAERLMREQERITVLTEMAAQETIEEHRSRWIAAVPFGAGQFQNGHKALGWFLGVAEGLLAAGSIATAVAHANLGSRDPERTDRDKFIEVERALRLSNWSLMGAFVGAATVGIIDAQVRFVRVSRTTRDRELPPVVEGSLGLGAAQLTVRF